MASFGPGGRGGRGAALLKAMKEPMRRPGEPPIVTTATGTSPTRHPHTPHTQHSPPAPPPGHPHPSTSSITTTAPAKPATPPSPRPLTPPGQSHDGSRDQSRSHDQSHDRGNGVRGGTVPLQATPTQALGRKAGTGRGILAFAKKESPQPGTAAPIGTGHAPRAPPTSVPPTTSTTRVGGGGPTPSLLQGHPLPSSMLTPPLSQATSSTLSQDTQASKGSSDLVKTSGKGRASLLQQQPEEGVASSGSAHLEKGVRKMEIAQREESTINKKGTSGAGVRLSANYLRVVAEQDGVYQYMVSFIPQVDNKNLRYRLLNEHKDVLGDTRAFDGSTLFLPVNITETTLVLKSTLQRENTEVELRITLVAVVAYAESIQLFNIIFKRVLRALELKQIGRHYYDPSNPIPVPQHKMELWPGYVTAIQEYDGGLMLLFDVSHRLLRTDSALDFLYELYSMHKDRFQDEATKQLVGSVVLTRYNNRTYRVDDILWEKNPQSTFTSHSGEAISFVDYYKKAYNKDIDDLEQPLLVHRPKRTKGDPRQGPEELICLVPELCCMTGLTDQARSDFKVMKDLAVHTRVAPNEREKSFRKFVENINSTPEARNHLSRWGLHLEPAIVQVGGRKLNPEKVFFKKKFVVSEEADWGRDSVKENVISAVTLKNWLVMFTRRDQSKAMDFVSMMKRVCPPMAIQVNEPQVVELPSDRTDVYLHALRDSINPHLQLVVIVFPTSRDDRYSAVKKLCCIERPIPSQVIISKTIAQEKKLRSVTQKIALQMNVKLGGELWAVEIPMKNIMVVGIDVYHDTIQPFARRSITGFVASMNSHLTRWYSRVAIQGQQQEIIDGLKLCLLASIKKYHEVNSTLPERVLVYRDGVGDGQMQAVEQFEVQQMLTCFKDFGDDYNPRVAVVIVQKRITTRIFSTHGNKLANPPPGTIVDHTITRRGWYDFFLVSQHVRQGTVTPTHYTVLHDTSGLKPDHLQRLTYKLTHMYYNWPGTIRVPAPCQYAHKLAYLVGQSLHKDPSEKLADRLFFL